MAENGSQNARDFVRFKGALTDAPIEVDYLFLKVSELDTSKIGKSEIDRRES